MQGVFRKSVVVFYWIALPLALLVCTGWLIGAVLDPSDGNAWMMSAGAGVFAGAIGWRLWLNSRSLGRVGPVPPTRRLLLVVLPLVVLAMAGLGCAALGIAWLGIGAWLLLAPDAATSGFRDLVTGAALPIGGGALMIVVGAAMVVPLLRCLKARPAPADSF